LRSSWESLGRLTWFASTTDDGGNRVSCQGHRSSSAVTWGSSWATMSCLPCGSVGSSRCPSLWMWRSTTAHFAHSPENNANW
jgi:hypothetical protein